MKKKYVWMIFKNIFLEYYLNFLLFDSFCKCLLFFKRFVNISYSILFCFLDSKIFLLYYE